MGEDDDLNDKLDGDVVLETIGEDSEVKGLMMKMMPIMMMMMMMM